MRPIKKTIVCISFIALLSVSIVAADEPPQKTETATTETATTETTEPSSDRKTSITSRIMLKVIHPDDVRKELVAAAEKIGGFPILITDEKLKLKVPPAHLSNMVTLLSEKGILLEKTLERKDLTQEIAALEGQLRSKTKILAHLRSFFADSHVVATLRIEESMNDLVRELEHVKGRLRLLNEQSKWAVIDISFTFQRRDNIIYVESPFEWINTVDLDRFIEEF